MKPELWAFLMWALIAFAQVFLLRRIMLSVILTNRKLTLFWVLIKFVSYGVAVYFLVFKLSSHFMYCFCGFAAGMPIAAFIIYLCATRYKNKRRFRG